MSAPFPAELKAVLFDLDGTLVDTADEFVPVVQTLRAEHGLAPMDAARIRASVSNGARALVQLGLGLGEDDPDFETQRLRLLDPHRYRDLESFERESASYRKIADVAGALLSADDVGEPMLAEARSHRILFL